MTSKEKIKENFSKCAPYYDKYSTIQNVCALQLIAKLKTNNFCRILELGCGTGNYTKLLHDKFPNAKTKAIDISFEMIKIARRKLKDERVEFIIADGEKIDFNEQFDLISSNASFQWFAGLEQALARYKKLLSNKGVISFSTFGPLTFLELNDSLKELFGKEVKISACIFFEKASLENILKDLFRNIKVEQKIYKERHDSLSRLLKKIRYTGTRGNGINRDKFWTAKLINELEKIYQRKFKNIITTHQVFFCKGVK